MKKFGELLIEEGYATPAQIKRGLAEQVKERRPLGEVMVELGYITADQRDYVVQLQLGELSQIDN